MTQIKKLIKSRVNELALIELQAQQAEDFPKTRIVSTSVKLYENTIKNLDIIGEKLELNRSELIRSFLDAGVREALIELNIDPLEWNQPEYEEVGGESDE